MKSKSTLSILIFSFTLMLSQSTFAQQIRGMGLIPMRSPELEIARINNAKEFESLRSVATEEEKFDRERDLKVVEQLDTLRASFELVNLAAKLKDPELAKKADEIEKKTKSELVKLGNEIVPYLIDSFLYEYAEFSLAQNQVGSAGLVLQNEHLNRIVGIKAALNVPEFRVETLKILKKVRASAQKQTLVSPNITVRKFIEDLEKLDAKEKEKKIGKIDQESKDQEVAFIKIEPGLNALTSTQPSMENSEESLDLLKVPSL
ncbi:MAG: hypothetical protein J0L93_05255 [Deltaproteobacteria bacterium]|nr:hypothetical protein [Deltaproteobacteria bacterium]